MRDFKQVCIRYFFFCGAEREEYRKSKAVIVQRNQETLLLASVMTTLLFAGLLTGSFFSKMMVDAQMFYAAMFVACAAIWFLTVTLVRKKPGFVMPAWYLLFLAFGCYAVVLNTFLRPTLSATTVCVFLVAGPLLIIDRPIRVIGFQALLSVVYVLCAIRTKTAYMAFADSVNVACCIFLGAAIYIRLTRVRMREIIQARLLQKERDTDYLTALLNKAAIEKEIRARLAHGQPGVLVIIDIDNFKHINDTYGHSVGDAILQRAAYCIRETSLESDLCGRFGGDEFLLYLPALSGAVLTKRLDDLQKRLREMVVLPNVAETFSVSMGAACFPGHCRDYPELFCCADMALYQAKKAGKGRYVVSSK